MLNANKIKADFPLLKNYPNLSYLDSAATSQKPQAVLNAINNYYKNDNANVHRGVHFLSDKATAAFEESKIKIAQFFGAQKDELIFTQNTTSAINGVARGWAEHNLHEGEIILSTLMEHHSNLVPWQQLALRKNATLELVNVTPEGLLDLADLEANLKKFGNKIKLVALTHVSNTLGTVNPLEQIIKLVKKYSKAKILIDGAQAVPHQKIDFAKLGVDFYAFSAHKMLGPMGVGGLLVKKKLLENNELEPWVFGGGMIDWVCPKTSKFQDDLTERFVAGTPNVAGAVGLAAACQYLQKLGMIRVEEHDKNLVAYALAELGKIKKIKVVGPLDVKQRLGSVAFIHNQVHAHDVAQVLDSEGIAVRSGHHCCMPLHENFAWQATVRASFQVYNNKADVDKLIKGLEKVNKVFL